jgi:hypothetical protein
MSGKTIYETESPKTQTVVATEALAKYLNRTIEGGVLDLGAVKLVKSNKGDVFYTVTANACSCPSHTYRGGPCKHMRKHFSIKPAQPQREESFRPTSKWHGHNGPVMPEEARPKDLLKEMEAQGYEMSFEADW